MTELITSEREALAARYQEGQRQLAELHELEQTLIRQLIGMEGGIAVYDELLKKIGVAEAPKPAD